MSALLVWMDQQEAKLFEIENDRINVKKICFEGPEHPPETLGRNHPRHQTDEQRFYSQLAKKMTKIKSKNWLLMGPSFGASHFLTYLEHSFPELFNRVIGFEKVDKMPDSEILSTGRKYLQRYYLYHAG